MIRKLAIAQIILLLGLGSIYLLPRGYNIRAVSYTHLRAHET